MKLKIVLLTTSLWGVGERMPLRGRRQLFTLGSSGLFCQDHEGMKIQTETWDNKIKKVTGKRTYWGH